MSTKLIHSWSPSKLADFEKCRYFAYLKHAERIPEPERPLPEGKTEHANDRGTRVHTAAELYVRGDGDFIPEMKNFQMEFERLRELYKVGAVSLEGEWGVNINWEPCDWKKAWHRVKLDAMVRMTRTHAVVIDYKTGKRFGNEIKHAEQMTQYQLNAFMRYPELETVTTELWYLDVNELARLHFTRNQGLRFKTKFHNRGLMITQATSFPPNPNVFSCRWCGYGPWGTGHCKVGKR